MTDPAIVQQFASAIQREGNVGRAARSLGLSPGTAKSMRRFPSVDAAWREVARLGRPPSSPDDHAAEKARFLARLRQHGAASRAARESGIAEASARYWCRIDSAFAAAWSEAVALGRQEHRSRGRVPGNTAIKP